MADRAPTARLAGLLNLILLLIFCCTAAGAVTMVPDRTRQALDAIIATFQVAMVATMWTAGLVLPVGLLAGLAGCILVGLQFIRATRIKVDLRQAEALQQRYQAGSRVHIAPRDHQLVETFASPELAAQATAKLYHLGDAHTNGKQAWSETHANRWQQWQLLTMPRARGDQLAQQPLLEPPDPDHIVDLLAREQRLLIWGASGSGKSSLLKHVANSKLQQETQLLVCDPHGSRPKWGPSVDAIGFGERYGQILDTLRALEFEHTARIRQIEHGRAERDFPIITIILEEVQALVEHFNQAGEDADIGYYIRMLLTRTRKTGIDIIAVSQEVSVKALGLEGFGKNRSAFAMAETTGRDGRGHKVHYTNEYGDRVETDPPPYWPSDLPVGISQNKIIYLPPPPSHEETQIIDILRADPDATDYQISKQVWGAQGSSYKTKIEAVKAKFGPF